MTTTLTVRFHELDPYGHVNHAVYLTYLEVARIDHLAARGIDLLALDDRLGVRFVVVGIEVAYLAPAASGDRLRVTCELQRCRRASATFTQTITRQARAAGAAGGGSADDATSGHPVPLLTATVRTATIGTDGRPVPLPPELTAALTAPVVAVPGTPASAAP